MSSYKRGYYMHSEFVVPTGSSAAHRRPRFFSPRECARLQGFPETFCLSEERLNSNRVYHHLGNAVCPPIIAAIGECMLRAFEQQEGTPPAA